MKRKIKLYEIIASITVFIFMLIMEVTGSFFTVSNELEDAVYQHPGVVDADISVIGIDEYTLKEYGAYETWIRPKTTELINWLMADSENKPSIIAIDISFFGTKDAATDQALVDAVKAADNVVLVSAVTFSESIKNYSDGTFSKEVVASQLEEPFDALKEAAKGIGHANVIPDKDGVIRHGLGSISYEGKDVKSFDEVIYNLYTGKDSFVCSNSFYIEYTGEPRDYFKGEKIGTSMLNVLNNQYPHQEFKNKIVYIGAYAAGMQDAYNTPINGEMMNGVEIHANILNQMIEEREVKSSPKVVNVCIILVICAISVVVFLFLPFKISGPIEGGIGILYFLFGKLLYTKGTLLPIFNPLLGLVVLFLLCVFIKYWGIHMEKKRLIGSYGKYLSPEIAATISEESEKEIKLGGVKRDIAVLFVDIRGFTTLSEKMSPDKVVEMLNSYLKVTTSSIFNQKGTVDKFIGDATMGVFNAPLELDDYTYRAVCAGLEMARRAVEVDESLPEDLKGKVGFGIGINCGEAVIGNIGADFRMEYTAIGDTVNTASRLEGQAKRGCVVISEAVYERVKDRIECEDLGLVKLKGKEKEVQIYRAIKEIVV